MLYSFDYYYMQAISLRISSVLLLVPYMGCPVSALLTVKLNVSDPVVTLYKVLEALLTMGLGGQGTS